MDKELLFKKAIVDNLSAGERIICLSEARKSKSSYATLLNSNHQYLTFRISHHSTYSGFLSIPTFETSKEKPLEVFLKEYMPIATWIPFDYKDFFVLSVIKLSENHGISFQIDDLYSVFSNELQGMIFYQVRVSHRRQRVRKIAANVLDDEVNQVFRKLYATSLISSRKDSSDTLRLYISAAGMRLLDLFTNEYIHDFISDYKNMDWENIRLPE